MKTFKNFNELTAKMSPERLAKIDAQVEKLTAEMALSQLREARDITQGTLARSMDISQAAVSQMERQTDMYVSSLKAIIQAMGGRMEVRAIFPDFGEVVINQFGDVKEHDATERNLLARPEVSIHVNAQTRRPAGRPPVRLRPVKPQHGGRGKKRSDRDAVPSARRA